MDLRAYLDRINFQDSIGVSKNILYRLQKHHLLNIPFENLDIHYGKKINLSVNDFYRKIVVGKRGGFCYELNGLFHSLLKEIGFDAKLISAQVHTKNGTYSPEYDHLAIIVNLENQEFLVDVGFGKFSLEPLLLKIGHRINDSYGQFEFDKYSADYYRVNEVKNNDLIPQYIFCIKERELSEFKDRCEFHQTSQDSHFTKKKLISIAKHDGRLTLNNSQLKITRSGIEEEIEFNENEFERKLKQYFEINLAFQSYNDSLSGEDKVICKMLSGEIDQNLPEAESKIWHAHPVWFLEGNPIVGYSKLKDSIRMMFWSGASFDEEKLKMGTGKFKDASIHYTHVDQINPEDLKRWLEKSRKIQWDYKNIIKRKGMLERLK